MIIKGLDQTGLQGFAWHNTSIVAFLLFGCCRLELVRFLPICESPDWLHGLQKKKQNSLNLGSEWQSLGEMSFQYVTLFLYQRFSLLLLFLVSSLFQQSGMDNIWCSSITLTAALKMSQRHQQISLRAAILRSAAAREIFTAPPRLRALLPSPPFN